MVLDMLMLNVKDKTQISKLFHQCSLIDPRVHLLSQEILTNIVSCLSLREVNKLDDLVELTVIL